jgi:glycosyltransferase involved in cell wall biosynthesis
MRELVMATIADQPDIEMVGEVQNESDLADIVEQVQPDVLIIATSRPGTQLADVVAGRGIVVEPGDAAAFARAIEQLAENPGLRESLGRSAREYALSALEKQSILSLLEQELLDLASAS